MRLALVSFSVMEFRYNSTAVNDGHYSYNGTGAVLIPDSYFLI